MALTLVCPVVSSRATAETRLNLPQVRQTIRLPESVQTAAREFLRRSPAVKEFSPAVERGLLQSVPEKLSSDCGDLMVGWAGEETRPSARWSVRILHQRDARAWLAFKCGSQLARLSAYHDERLGFLDLDNSILELLPLGPETRDNEDVHEIVLDREVPLPNLKGAAFRVNIPQNPCCDGPESRSVERLMIFAETPAGAVESLSLVVARTATSHCDDPEIDTETNYRARVNFKSGSGNIVSALSSTFRETIKETSWESGAAHSKIIKDLSGQLNFNWNLTRSVFEEAH